MFRQDMPDDEWLSIVGPRGYIVFSCDRKFHETQAELAAIKQHSIGCFYLWGANAHRWDQLTSFVKGFDAIVQAIDSTPRAFLYRVPKVGPLKRILLP